MRNAASTLLPRRREILAAAIVSAFALERASAQQDKASLPIVGVLSPISLAQFTPNLAAILRGMREAGFEEGRHYRIEHRLSGGAPERLPALAADLVALPSRVIVAGSTAGALAARSATRDIPIIFIGVSEDPVAIGLVASIARPGGNITGFTLGDDVGLVGKRLEVLKEAIPTITRVTAFVNPDDATDAPVERLLPGAGQASGITIDLVRVRRRDELVPAITDGAAQSDGLYISLSPLFNANRAEIAALVARLRKPAVYGFREFAVSGGLIAYGASLADLYYGATNYIVRILRGDRVADLPVQQPTNFRLVVNLAAFNALGISPSLSILARADELIE